MIVVVELRAGVEVEFDTTAVTDYPFGKWSDLIIDWGDGTIDSWDYPKGGAKNYPRHNYDPALESATIKIHGYCAALNFTGGFTYKIIDPGEIDMRSFMMIRGQWTGMSKQPTPHSWRRLTRLNIDGGTVDPLDKINFNPLQYAYALETIDVDSMPMCHDQLPFQDCPKLRSYTHGGATWRDQIATNNLPSDLFINNPDLERVSVRTYGTGQTVGNEIFRNNQKISFIDFRNHYYATAFPENMISNERNPLLTILSLAFLYFGSGSNAPIVLTKNVLAGCSNITNMDRTFEASGITAIENGALDGLGNVANFQRCFYNCNKITGDVPELWNMYPNASGSGCFAGCTNAANYNSIPASWK